MRDDRKRGLGGGGLLTPERSFSPISFVRGYESMRHHTGSGSLHSFIHSVGIQSSKVGITVKSYRKMTPMVPTTFATLQLTNKKEWGFCYSAGSFTAGPEHEDLD